MAQPTDAGTNWYAFLGVPTDATEEEVATRIERLSRQAAALATTAPERSQQLRDTVRAIRADLLSGAQARARYDDRLASAAPPVAAHPLVTVAPRQAPPSADSGTQEFLNSLVNGLGPAAHRFRRFLQSGWTCPSCGADGGPADQFCSHCGGPMKNPTTQVRPPRATCPACATTLGAGDQFCPRCGVQAS